MNCDEPLPLRLKAKPLPCGSTDTTFALIPLPLNAPPSAFAVGQAGPGRPVGRPEAAAGEQDNPRCPLMRAHVRMFASMFCGSHGMVWPTVSGGRAAAGETQPHDVPPWPTAGHRIRASRCSWRARAGRNRHRRIHRPFLSDSRQIAGLLSGGRPVRFGHTAVLGDSQPAHGVRKFALPLPPEGKGAPLHIRRAALSCRHRSFFPLPWWL